MDNKDLKFKKRNFWLEASKEDVNAAKEFSTDYIKFLNNCKTERESVTFTIDMLKEKGFNEVLSTPDGKRVYADFRHKSMAFAVIGNRPVSDGVNVVCAHVDAPRIDLKQNPLYEDKTTALAMGITHYYGGIKKYQWVSTPLAIHGVVINKDGETVKICIGENDEDPVFVIPDLLPHLSRKVQGPKTIGEAVSSDNLNIVLSSMPIEDEEEKEAIKTYLLQLLNEKYGIVEEDLLSAEIEIVPAAKARECGFDRSMVLGYGQDDRICAYAGLKALLDINPAELDKTAVVYFSDKEEIGSDSNTGAKSVYIRDFICDLLKQNGEDCGSYNFRKTLIKSNIMSADVAASINPNYKSVHDPQNAPVLGHGVSLVKFTGAGGKGGSNDANAEFNAKVIRIFKKADVFWQTAELGKVDEGGGGTIAKFFAEHGSEVIDCGTGLLGMHSLYELCSKADLYSTYKAYKAFLLNA